MEGALTSLLKLLAVGESGQRVHVVPFSRKRENGQPETIRNGC
jgi:hypothetical protein